MNEINPQEVHTTNATLTSEPAIRAARNAVAQEGIDKLSVDSDLVRELTTATSHKLDKWGAANQKASGRCWIFAGLNSLRGGIMDRTNIKDFELSQTYLYFYDKLEKANWFLTAVDELKDRDITDRTLTKLMDDPIGDGGQWSMFVSLVEKYGVVPKYAMPETASSESSAMLNRNLETVLRRAAHQIRAGKSGAQEHALADVYRILTALEEFLYARAKTIVIMAEGSPAQLIRQHSTREVLEREIEQFSIVEREGLIIACAALYPIAVLLAQAGMFVLRSCSLICWRVGIMLPPRAFMAFRTASSSTVVAS